MDPPPDDVDSKGPGGGGGGMPLGNVLGPVAAAAVVVID